MEKPLQIRLRYYKRVRKETKEGKYIVDLVDLVDILNVLNILYVCCNVLKCTKMY